MKTLTLFAAVAGLTLVSAAPPAKVTSTVPIGSGYPPCSASVTDRCIQLHERGVRSASNMARNGKANAAPKLAQGGPYEPESTAVMGAGDYPRCSATVRDRCVQGSTSHRPRTARRVMARDVRAAGERG